MAKQFVDDKYIHLESDIDKIREKYRMYISFSNEKAAFAIVLEIIFNALDETKNPRSPADTIKIEYTDEGDTITVSDNGRGIPLNVLETVLTTLNSGSNIDSGSKSDLETSTLGRNGVGTLAMTALGEFTEVTSYRGGTENKFKRIVFHEGKKVSEEEGKCPPSKHGLTVSFRPSKILGRKTKIPWNMVEKALIDLQFTNDKNVKIISEYLGKQDDKPVERVYKVQPFEEILSLYNAKDCIITDKARFNIYSNDVIEEVGGNRYKRFISMDIAFLYSSSLDPYIDSFCNLNNTVDNGDHIDASVEALCRYFQQVTKATLTERDKLDIKWDDVKTGLSLVVSLNTNMEDIFTGQTKHKVSNENLQKLIRDLTMAELHNYFERNPAKLKQYIGIVKANARARREGDKARTAVMKDRMTNWSSFKMKNFDPCTNKGKEYKELYIIEGDSAKGSLKDSRDPIFQALFAIRGVSANVFKLDLNGVLANAEFNGLIKVMGCDVGVKFDINRLQYDKIIIASDADVDGLFIRSLLCSFFFKIYPEIIQDGRLFIAEPPLYRVDDKKNPFVINKEDYVQRYIQAVMKEYKVGWRHPDGLQIELYNKDDLREFLSATSSYVDDITQLSRHYKVNDRLIEMVIEEIVSQMPGTATSVEKYGVGTSMGINTLEKLNIQKLMNRIGTEFKELYYDDKDKLIKGAIDGKYQLLEIGEGFLRKLKPLILIMEEFGSLYAKDSSNLVLKHNKTGAEQDLSLLRVLKILKKYQPNILHRFKGLGENNDEDIRTTIMDPNTRTLIRVQISDIENDMEIFQMLRSQSPDDKLARKAMMRAYKIPRDLIDT